jgi:hypothetical protein
VQIALETCRENTVKQRGGICDMFGGGKKCIQEFDGETQGKRPLGRPRRRREGNIKMDS